MKCVFSISGFFAGDGAFSLSIKAASTDAKFAGLKFIITQHINNFYLLQSFILFLGLKDNNILNPSLNKNSQDISVAGNKNFINIILPFFELYPLYGIKSIQFITKQSLVILMSNNNHRLIDQPGQPWDPLVKSEIERVWLYDKIYLNGSCLPNSSSFS
jgi:hypothetical protein